MKVEIFVEGGGNQAITRARCRQAFSAYCSKIAQSSRSFAIVPCGGRSDAFRSFQTASEVGSGNKICALLLDAETPVSVATPIEHLRTSDGWNIPANRPHSVFLMVQAMEAWFLADRQALQAYYGNGFRGNSLPGTANDVEAIRKNDLEPSLKHASRDTSKGEYHKTKHGFDLLAKIDPARVEKASPHAANFHRFLRSL